MDKIFTKRLFLVAIFSLLAFKAAVAQTITIGNVDPGPYAPNSSIGVPISVSGPCVTSTATYKLYLSDATGSFTAKKLIGTFTSFYATFVNGVIPAGTPAGNGYKVEVISANPTVTSTISAVFTITTGAAVTAAISSQVINPTYPNVFGTCSGANNNSFNFIDNSTTGSTVTASFFNDLSQTPAGSITPTPSGVSFTAAAANYTITVRAINGGVVGTECYLLINNTVNTSFGVTGSNATCLSGGASITYNVDITSTNGIENNFPGLVYSISWGDGSPSSSLTFCQIQALGGKITHTFIKSSCGSNPAGQANSFEVNFQPTSVYCGKAGTEITSYAQVIAGPTNSFAPVPAACTNTPVTFTNTSFPGQDPANKTASCAFASANYTWIVDGVQYPNYTLAQNFTTTFATTGNHTVTLHLANSNALCSTTDFTQTVCVQNSPTPLFTLTNTTGCIPFSVTPINSSVIDATCTPNQYVWTVTGPANVIYAAGTTANSQTPQFVFASPGTYTIVLGITTPGCGTITTAPQTITVSSPPTASLSPDANLCGSNQTLTFNTDQGPTQTTLSGNPQTDPSTYQWTVTPSGAFSFTGGTSASSQYPQINFTGLTTYTISVTNTNNCSPPATATQHITFLDAPTISAGADQTFCSDNPAQLNGSISGNTSSVTGTTWTTNGTGTFSDPTILNPTYTPSAADITTATVTLTLTATTSLAGQCGTIPSNVTLTITPPDAITSAATAAVCSGAPLNYLITAANANSTFTWSVDPANTSASASGYTTNGTSANINDAITNSDPANNATVTYDITAVGSSGCASSKFVLTVTVAPKTPIANFTQDVTTGCDNLAVQFTNHSTPTTSSYQWSFGDGATSTDVNPSHTFAPRTDGKDTVYTVSLVVITNCGNSQPFLSTVTVRPKVPVAYITPKQLIGCSPFTLAVDNFSPGTNQQYDYYLYNGATLVQQITMTDKSEVRFNPITVTTTTQFSLYMVATGFCGTTGQSTIIPITVSASNIVSQAFIENNVNKGCAPLMVNLINNSIGGDNYYYTVYDVNHTVVDRRPAGTGPLAYTFNTAGTFYVTITAANSCATVESTPPIRVDVFAAPLPQFSADVTSGCRSLTVNFTNQTPDDATAQATSLAYDWDFGDGSPHETTFTPQPHTYSFKNSPYTVTLTATNLVTNCSNTVIKADFINIISPPATAFTEKPDSITNIPNYHFSFIDETSGGAVSWKWSFGDGQSSISQNPGHTYIDTGLYKVTLTATSQAGCDSTISHNVRITGIPGQLFLPNAFEPDGATTELRTFMAKGSGIKTWHMQVFNNYAQLVWETTKLDDKGAPVDGWDGTFKGSPAPQGVYIWQVSATFINGTDWKGNVINNSLPKRTGVINLIR